MAKHFYLKETSNSDPVLIRELTIEILNYYHHPGYQSKHRWRKIGKFIRKWTDAQHQLQTSQAIGYDIIAGELMQSSNFDSGKFLLYPLEEHWLDNSLAVAKVIPPPAPFLEIGTEAIYGTINPVEMHLDDPGVMVTSMMNHLFRFVVKRRSQLIGNSDNLLTLEWYLELRNIICDAVSLVDMTLNRLHYKAENDPNQSWTVAPNLAPRHGGRLLDKIKFVYQCTGNNLPNISVETAALTRLKDFRNQFMHFDPPYFKHTFSEIVILLNDMILIGKLLFKIRKTIGAAISSGLVLFMLMHEIEFVINPHEARVGITM